MKKGLLLILVAVVAIVGIIAGTTALKKPSAELKLNNISEFPAVAASSFGYYDADNIIVSNDGSLITYNFKTGVSRSLSGPRTGRELGRLDSLTVSDDKRYVLFHASYATPGGTLSSRLTALKQDPEADYWWLFDSSNRSYTPLPSGTTKAKFYDGSLYVLRGDAPNQTLGTYPMPSLQQPVEQPATATTDFYRLNDGYILQTPDNKIVRTTDGTTSTVLATNSTLSAVDTASQSIIAIRQTGKDAVRDLISISATTGKIKTLAKNIQGDPSYLPQGLVGYSLYGDPGQENYTFYKSYIYNLKDGTDTLLLPPQSRDNGSSAYAMGTLLAPDSLLMSGSNNTSYLVGLTTQGVKKTDNSYQQIIQVGNRPVTISHDDQTDGFVAFPVLSDAAAEIQSITQKLSADGYNPDLYPISIIDVTD